MTSCRSLGCPPVMAVFWTWALQGRQVKPLRRPIASNSWFYLSGNSWYVLQAELVISPRCPGREIALGLCGIIQPFPLKTDQLSSGTVSSHVYNAPAFPGLFVLCHFILKALLGRAWARRSLPHLKEEA